MADIMDRQYICTLGELIDPLCPSYTSLRFLNTLVYQFMTEGMQ